MNADIKPSPWRRRLKRCLLCSALLLVLLLGLATLTGDWYVWVISATDGGPGLLFFEARYVTTVPDDAPAFGGGFGFGWLTAFDFSIGWRTRLSSAKKVYRDDLSGHVVVITTDWGGREYYAVSGGTFALIRLEGSNGEPGRNIYHAPNLRVGSAFSGRTEEQWEAELLADDPGRNLQALVWLAGIHLDTSRAPNPNFHHEPMVEATLAAAVRKRPAVVKRLAELTKSEHQWLKDGAILAVTAPTGVPW